MGSRGRHQGNQRRVEVRPMNGGLHATTGPNIIFWDPQQTAMGNYTVKATLPSPSRRVILSHTDCSSAGRTSIGTARGTALRDPRGRSVPDQETKRHRHQQRCRRLGGESCGDRSPAACRRTSCPSRSPRARQLHGNGKEVASSSGNRDRHQWRRRPSHRSWIGCSDRWVRGNAIAEGARAHLAVLNPAPPRVYVKKPIIISSHV